MKLFTLIIAFVISSSLLNAQGWMWVKHFNGTGQNMPTNVIQDAAGNNYVYGNINGAVSQDGISLTTNGQDAFLAKYNSAGQIQWIKQLGGTFTQTAGSIVFSNDKNYIYLSLLNNGTFSFEGTDIPTIGGFDIIIVQFDISGNYQWAFNAAYGASNQTNGVLAIDNSENIILAGGFLNDVTFLGGYSLISPSASNQKFIAKFDSWGNLYWANKIDDDNTNTTIKSISTDANGYYFSGQFAGNFYLPTGTLTSNSTYREGFIYKTDMDGNGIWARKISAINNDLYINKHITDNSGNNYLAGYYNGVRLKIDSTSTDTSKINYLNTTSGTSDLIILKYNTDGNLEWTKAIGSIKNEKAINLGISNNKLLITGSYEGSVNFGLYNLTNSGGSDAFIAECDLNGSFTNAIKAAGSSTDIGQACTYSSTSRNYTAIGDFVSVNVTIGTTQLINSLSGIRDAYVAKYGCFDSLHLSSTIICVDEEGLPISNDGTATATPSEGSEPYTYLWSNNETTPTITGLTAGTYSVTVSGANNCTAINSVNVSLSTDLVGTINQNNISCSGGNDGYAAISVSGGNTPYTYIWSNSETTSEIYNLLPGTYYVTVTDQCGISLVDNAIITEPSPLEVNMTFTNLTCNGHGDDGTATATAAFGNEPYTYAWSNDSTNASVTGLVAGTYDVSVTDKCGTMVVESVTISIPPVLITNVINRLNVTCFGLCNGSATADVTSGTSPFIYSWSTTPAQTDANAINLCAGNYSVTVTDAAGCTSVSNFSISEPTVLSGTMGQTNTSCAGSCNGSAWITPSGGTAPINYLWEDAQTNDTIYSLCVGKYKVTITDFNNCVYIDSVNVIQPFTINANIIPTSVTCYGGCNGTATSAPTGGIGIYTYLWSTTPVETSNTASSLCAGKYYLTVTDATGCTIIDSVTITEPDVLTGTMGQINASCYGLCNGSAWITPTGGTAPFSYLWNDAQTNDTILLLCIGKYKVTITDFNNCFYNDSVDVIQPSVLIANITPTNVTCYGSCNGTATSAPTGGTAIYTYSWSTSPVQTSNTASSLCAGKYYLTVTDELGCKVIDSVTLIQPDILSATISQNNGCNGSCNATATITPSGGSMPYTYIWDNAQTIPTATGLCAGDYAVTVTDACNSNTTKIVTIIEPEILTADSSQTYPTGSQCNGTATITPTGGTTPYTYQWNTTPVQNNATSTGLCAAFFTVTLTDNNGCTLSKTYNLVGTTKLSDAFCDLTTSNSSTIIYCDQVYGVQDYEWEFSNSGISYYETRSNVWPSNPGRNYIRISYMPNILNGYIYDVRVRAKVNGIWGQWGQVCQINLTFTGTKLQDAYCGATFNDDNNLIYVDGVYGVTNYEFRFINSEEIFNQSVTTATIWGINYGYRNYIKISDIPNILYGLTYDVQIRYFINGVWSEYGPVCQLNLFITSTKLRDDFCNITTSNKSLIIYCDPVTSVQDYEWEFSCPEIEFYQTRNNVWPSNPSYNFISLSYIPNIVMGHIYNVRVRAKYDGQWGIWGPICQINLTVPNTKLRSDFCNITTPNKLLIIYCDPISNVQDYEWEFTCLENSYYQTIHNVWPLYPNRNYIRISYMPDIPLGYTYNVRVRAKVDNSWGNYSDVCQITLSASKSVVNNTVFDDFSNSLFNIAAYPNPYVESTSLFVETNSADMVTINIADISGRIIFSTLIEPNKEWQLNERLTNGVYFIQAADSAGQKAVIKVIKTH